MRESHAFYKVIRTKPVLIQLINTTNTIFSYNTKNKHFILTNQKKLTYNVLADTKKTKRFFVKLHKINHFKLYVF